MTAGRPTDYTPELLEKAHVYYTSMRAIHEENNTKSISEQRLMMPSIAELALQLDISRETVYAWAKDANKAEFSDIVDRVMTLQELVLHDQGLFGVFNPSITKLMLTKHGYTDKQDVTTGGKELPTPIIPLNAIQRDDSTT